MRLALLVIAAVITGYGFYLLSQLGPGNYVKVYAGSYLWEQSLIGFIIAVVIFVLALYLLISLFRFAWRSPKSFSRWRSRSHRKQADQNFGAGYLSLIKGDWRQAEKNLLNKSDASGVPYVNYLAAAQAAQELGKTAKRDEYLNQALKTAPKSRFAIGLAKARLHLSAGEIEQAEATLQDLQQAGRKNGQYLALAIQTYMAAGHSEQALALLPSARKYDAMPTEELDQISDQAYSAKLKNATSASKAWKELPRDQRAKTSNVAIYAQALIDTKDHSEAEKILRAGLKKSLDSDLIRLFGRLESAKPGKLRKAAESWLVTNPNNAELRLIAGRFAMQEKKFDDAETHLQSAIQIEQLPQAYALLGELYEANEDSSKALHLYRLGISALSSNAEQRLTRSLIAPSMQTPEEPPLEEQAVEGQAIEGKLLAS